MCSSDGWAWAGHEIGHGQVGMSQEILDKIPPQAACSSSGVRCSDRSVTHCGVQDSALSLKMTFGALNESKHFPDCVCSTAKLIWSQK